MNELIKFYTKSLVGLVGMATAWVLFVPKNLMPFLVPYLGPGQWTQRIAAALTSRLFIVFFLAGGEFLIRKWLWKLVYPKLNFQGEWEGKTTYETVEIGSPEAPFSVDHEVAFEQDCLSFFLAPTKSKKFVNWGSLAANLVDEHTVRYAYWVTYGVDDPNKVPRGPKFPPNAKGYEELRVVGERGWRGKPKELSGEFYHCAIGFNPVYRGSVVFKRKGHAKPKP